MTSPLKGLLLVVAPLTVAVVLFWHPAGGENVFEDVRGDATAWILVHLAMLFAIPLLAIATYLLLDGIRGRAVTVSRVALVFFLVFYTAWEVTVGLATGILVKYADGLPAAEQAAVADSIQHLTRNPILGEPSVAFALGATGWIVAMIAAAAAFRRAGAAWPATLLVGFASLFAVHPPPIGPVGLVCFAAGAALLERSRTRETRARSDPARSPAAVGAAPAPARAAPGAP
jgi:hypothetical protein